MTLQANELQALARRVERLEKQNRSAKIRTAIALTLTSAAVMMAATRQHSRTVEAERFVLRGADGQQRAVLATTDAQGRSGGLLIFSSEGQPRLSLGVVGGLPDVTLLYGSGSGMQKRAILSMHEDGSPGLQLADPNGIVRVALALTADGSAGLTLNGRNGKPRAFVSLVQGDTPGLVLTDTSGHITFRAP